MFLKMRVNENTRRMVFEDTKSTAGVVGDSNVDGIIFYLPENSEYFEFQNAVVYVVFFDATNTSHKQVLDQIDDYSGMPKWTFDDNVLKNDATSQVPFFLHMVVSDTSGKVLKSWNTLPSAFIVYKNRDYNNQEEEAIRETDIDRLAGLVTTLTEKAKTIGDVEKVLASITGSSPKPVDTETKMIDDGHIYLYTGNETGFVTGALYYYIDGDLTYGGVYGSYDPDTTLTEAGKAADAGAVGAAIDEVKEDLDNNVNDLKSVIANFTGCEFITFTNGKYIKTNLNVGDLVDLTPITGYNTNNYAIVDVQEGDRITINATGGNAGRLWCFIDSTNHLISVSASNATVSDFVLVAPEYASKLILNPVTGYGNIFIGENLNNAVNKLLSADTTINMSITLTGAGVKYPTPASMDMFEKIVFDTDIGYAPQGIAVYNGIAYVSNGATPPLNVITEINLLDGTFVKHTIDGLVSGGNSVSIDPQNKILYVASHNDRGLVNIVDLNTWSMLGTARMANIGSAPEPNIVYDPSERCFYNYGITKIYKLDETFTTIKEIPLQLTQNNYPLAKPGTPQGFGYDGTFFYIPRSEVYDVYGSSYTFVFNKNGEFIKYYRGLHKEIEEYAYDFATGKSYACYAYSATGWVTEFATDSGWLNMCDYLVTGIENTTPATNVDSANSTAKMRIKDGVISFRGYLKVDSSATTNVIAYLDSRFAPMAGATAILRQTESSTFTNVTEFPCEVAFLNPYYVPDFRYLGSPIRGAQTGYIWLDGVTLPYGRRTDNQGLNTL